MSYRLLRLLFTTTYILTMGVSCLKKDGHTKEGVDLICRGVNTMCLDMLREVSSTTPGNILFSPFSIYTAFLMLLFGARNNTRKEIEATLKWIPDVNEDQMKLLYHNFLQVKKESYSLSLVNKAWIDKGVKPEKPYNDILRKIFQTEIGISDFSGNSKTSRSNINKWISQETDGHVKDLFPSGSIDSTTQMVLANAVYFKGRWASKFDVKNTHEGEFHLANGTTVQVSYMWKNGKLSSFFDSDRRVHVLEIPYEDEEFSTIFVMPQNSQIKNDPDLTKNEVLNEWIKELAMKEHAENIDITIPKFTLQQRLDLTDIFQRLGIRDLFTPEQADLSGITEKGNLYCGAAVHESFLKVDEEGTTAAGSTGMEMHVLSMPPHIKLDRPFIFYLIRKHSNIILFAGRVMDPTKNI